MLTEIVKRAPRETICDIGQLSKDELRQLNAAVKRGWLSKGKGGPFPKLKTMYACASFDFEADREREIAGAMVLADLDRTAMERRRARTGNANAA